MAQCSNPRSLARPSTLARVLPLLAVIASGCAGAAQKRDIVWPPPPEVARIKHLRAFWVPDDIAPSAWRKILNALIPLNPRAVLRSPICMALSPDEKLLYVTNPAAGTLVSVDLSAGKMEILGEGEPSRLLHPFGVAVDADGNVFVSDQRRDEVVVLDAKGGFVRRFGKEKLQGPTALALDRKRQVLYVLNGTSSLKTDHRVEAYSLKGDHLRTIGKRGSANGEFNFASHLAVAPDGRLLVSDMLNFRVQVFDPEGNFLSAFGKLGAGGPGYFDKSKGIALDTHGNIYVADALHAVQIFNPNFQPLMFFGEGFIQTPTGLLIDSRNHIYVSDPVSPFIHEFELVNTTAEDSFKSSPVPTPQPAKDPAKSPTGG